MAWHGIMVIISRVHVVAQDLRASQEQTGHHPDRPLPRSIVFTPRWEDEYMEFFPLKLKCSSSMLSHHITTQPRIIASFVQLLTHGLFARTTHTSGMTWLEIMFVTIAMGRKPTFPSTIRNRASANQHRPTTARVRNGCNFHIEVRTN